MKTTENQGYTKFPDVFTQKQAISYHSDPLSLYQHLCHDSANTLLLESAEIATKDHLKSLVMTDAALMIRADGYQLTFTALTGNGAALLEPIANYFNSKDFPGAAHGRTGDTLTVTLVRPSGVMDEDSRLKACSPLDGLRMLVNEIGGIAAFEDLFLGGVLAYDLIDTVEPLPATADGANHCPDYLFYLAETLLLIDHQQASAQLITHAFTRDDLVLGKLANRTANLISLAKAHCPAQALTPVDAQMTVNVSDEDFCLRVNELKEHIVAGDIFQVVPSRRFSLPCPSPMGAYRALRASNPSPYMFYFRGPDFTLFGASPESALKYDAGSNQVEVYPIAGTRPRGKAADGSIDADLDSRIELELRLDKKELSEHLMLVDLARNDIARIASAGSRKVAELLKVDRYSHVMHLVSRVTGQLRDDLDALHAYQACMNMGTLVGAPKVRASQLVRQCEGERRGSYGGAVGYLNGLGDMDTCIVIRSAFVADGVAHIQAGAGVVFDSVPQLEADETRQKAQAVINAILQGGGA
ncbi:anthranilate synthase component 1 [Shewanella sp. GXUN23E]|uniref:anthranilate synthase component 1 n=1 Tax=Shewanella sp. GXUN23E TaxID=3422498 RepID=UPI003D7D112C